MGWPNCDYVLRRWPSFSCYAQTGELPIDNNPVENAISQPVQTSAHGACRLCIPSAEALGSASG
ncbi:MAG: Transposase family [Pseudomonadota bacterium]